MAIDTIHHFKNENIKQWEVTQCERCQRLVK